jgi:hypothetical protein
MNVELKLSLYRTFPWTDYVPEGLEGRSETHTYYKGCTQKLSSGQGLINVLYAKISVCTKAPVRHWSKLQESQPGAGIYSAYFSNIHTVQVRIVHIKPFLCTARVLSFLLLVFTLLFFTEKRKRKRVRSK